MKLIRNHYQRKYQRFLIPMKAPNESRKSPPGETESLKPSSLKKTNESLKPPPMEAAEFPHIDESQKPSPKETAGVPPTPDPKQLHQNSKS
jgi:hypothetical protein